jgi:hypothetical protein
MMSSFEKKLLSGRLFDLSLGPADCRLHSSILRFKATRMDDIMKVVFSLSLKLVTECVLWYVL